MIAAAKPERTILRVTNTNGSDRVVTIKAGDNPPALAAGLGDLAVTVAATTGVQWLGPFESGRFLQADGSMEIDIAASMAGTSLSTWRPVRAETLTRGAQVTRTRSRSSGAFPWI